MKSKQQEKESAIKLRSQGFSVNEISKVLKVSKGSVSVWVRKVELTEEQKAQLNSKAVNGENFRKFHKEKWKTKEKIKRIELARKEAEEEWEALRLDPEFMFGLALYVGEGSKSDDFYVAITNYDPLVVKSALKFFLKIGVSKEKIKLHLSFHNGRDCNRIVKFWCDVLGLDKTHIGSITNPPIKDNPKRIMRPNGGCKIIVCNTHIKRKLLRWMELVLNGVVV